MIEQFLIIVGLFWDLSERYLIPNSVAEIDLIHVAVWTPVMFGLIRQTSKTIMNVSGLLADRERLKGEKIIKNDDQWKKIQRRLNARHVDYDVLMGDLKKMRLREIYAQRRGDRAEQRRLRQLISGVINEANAEIKAEDRIRDAEERAAQRAEERAAERARRAEERAAERTQRAVQMAEERARRAEERAEERAAERARRAEERASKPPRAKKTKQSEVGA